MRDRQPLILGRDAELAAASGAVTAAMAGRGSLVLVEGPAGIGRTTVLRAAVAAAEFPEREAEGAGIRGTGKVGTTGEAGTTGETGATRDAGATGEAAEAGVRVLTARGLALEQGFPFGIVRQLFEPLRAGPGPGEPGEWEALFDGAAAVARCVFDGADGDTLAGAAADGVPHAVTHGLYWLTAHLAARRPLVIVVDDAHWADAPSLRWLSYLAARVAGLPVALLLGSRSGPDQPEIIAELRALSSATTRIELAPLTAATTTELVREWLGGQASIELCRAAYDATGGNPFLLDALAREVRARGGDAHPDQMTVLSLGPRPVAEAVLRRVRQLGTEAGALTRALAVLGRPAPLRYAAALAGVDLARAAGAADALRAASVLASGALLEFEYPVVRTAVYDSIPPGERALAHARTARLLEADGADPELLALHLLRGEPSGDPHAVEVLRSAAAAASGRGAPDTAAGYLRRALAEPPPAAARAAVLLDLGLALASDRDPAAVEVLREAVDQAAGPAPGPDRDSGDGQEDEAKAELDRPAAALLSAGVLGVWGHHEGAAASCLAALGLPPRADGAAALDPVIRDQLEAGLFGNSWVNAATAASAWKRARFWLDRDDASGHAAALDPGAAALAWQVYRALDVTLQAGPGTEAMARLAPVRAALASAARGDSLTPVTALLLLIWNDELAAARSLCDTVLGEARARGSMNMMANACCLRTQILCRLGLLREAAAEGRAGLDFRLRSSPPAAVAWAAASVIEPLTRLGRFAEAADAVAQAEASDPPAGWLHTVLFAQAKGALLVALQRYDEGLGQLSAAAAGWRDLGITSPALACWRVPAVTAHHQAGRPAEAARLAAEQLDLARATGTAVTLGVSLRVAAPYSDHPDRMLTESLALLESADARYEHALAQAELGACLRRAGRRSDAQDPLRRALDWAERAGAAPLASYARSELLAAGARPRRTALTGPEALTTAERQVADLAAAGLSNRQIGRRLFISQATVETHLRHVFHKLGISSRTELPAQLPAEPGEG